MYHKCLFILAVLVITSSNINPAHAKCMMWGYEDVWPPVGTRLVEDSVFVVQSRGPMYRDLTQINHMDSWIEILDPDTKEITRGELHVRHVLKSQYWSAAVLEALDPLPAGSRVELHVRDTNSDFKVKSSWNVRREPASADELSVYWGGIGDPPSPMSKTRYGCGSAQSLSFHAHAWGAEPFMVLARARPAHMCYTMEDLTDLAFDWPNILRSGWSDRYYFIEPERRNVIDDLDFSMKMCGPGLRMSDQNLVNLYAMNLRGEFFPAPRAVYVSSEAD